MKLVSGVLPRVKRLTIKKSTVLRYSGCNAQKGPLNKRVLKLLAQEIDEAGRLLNPRGYFCVYEAAPFRQEKIFDDAEQVVLGVCTIGDGVEKRVQELFSQGEGARGVLLDAIGSAAAEEVANILNNEVVSWSVRAGLRATRRFSPGYGGWPVDGQELIFSNLKEAEEITGVSLTSAKMMNPLKSVSFAIKLGRGRLKEINKGTCAACSLAGSCSFRHREELCRHRSGDGENISIEVG